MNFFNDAKLSKILIVEMPKRSLNYNQLELYNGVAIFYNIVLTVRYTFTLQFVDTVNDTNHSFNELE